MRGQGGRAGGRAGWQGEREHSAAFQQALARYLGSRSRKARVWCVADKTSCQQRTKLLPDAWSALKLCNHDRRLLQWPMGPRVTPGGQGPPCFTASGGVPQCNFLTPQKRLLPILLPANCDFVRADGERMQRLLAICCRLPARNSKLPPTRPHFGWLRHPHTENQSGSSPPSPETDTTIVRRGGVYSPACGGRHGGI